MTAETSAESGDPNPFWKFSVRCWRLPDVERSCLVLQDEHGLNPNLLLFACWAAAEGRSLDGQRLAGSLAGQWHAAVTGPLRHARGEAKRLAVDAEACRAALREAELEVERVEQRLLYRERDLLTMTGHPAGGLLAAGNLRACASMQDCARSAALTDRLQSLLAACFPEADANAVRAVLESGDEPGPARD